MGKVIPFPKIKLDREEQVDIITDDISLELLILLEKYNIDTTRESFSYDMAWVVKFIEVMVSNQFGIETKLGELIRKHRPQDLYEKKKK
tara:strand:- start:1328 stop:1594 length:267 start_codon:yes stop_codon:yes gene_type:complete